jgi:pyrroline-5-carboxylate reductase
MPASSAALVDFAIVARTANEVVRTARAIKNTPHSVANGMHVLAQNKAAKMYTMVVRVLAR